MVRIPMRWALLAAMILGGSLIAGCCGGPGSGSGGCESCGATANPLECVVEPDAQADAGDAASSD